MVIASDLGNGEELSSLTVFLLPQPSSDLALVTLLGGGSSGKQSRLRLLQSCLPLPISQLLRPWLLENSQSANPGWQHSASPGSASRVCICAFPGIHPTFGTKNLLAVSGKSWKELGWDGRGRRQSRLQDTHSHHGCRDALGSLPQQPKSEMGALSTPRIVPFIQVCHFSLGNEVSAQGRCSGG